MPLRGEKQSSRASRGPHPGAQAPEGLLTQQPGLSPQTCSLSPTVSRPSGAPSLLRAQPARRETFHASQPSAAVDGFTDLQLGRFCLGLLSNVSGRGCGADGGISVRGRVPSHPAAGIHGRHCARPLTCPSGSVPLFRVRQVESRLQLCHSLNKNTLKVRSSRPVDRLSRRSDLSFVHFIYSLS